MANLLWNESAPADTDSVGQGDDEIRSLKTSIRNGMAEEHLWPSATGSNFGVHLLGSARPYYATQSLVSSTGSDGRLMVTSDTSRLFHVGSAGTMFLGGQTALSAGSSPVGGQRFYWAVEFGQDSTLAGGIKTLIFPNSGFSGKPFVIALPSADFQAGGPKVGRVLTLDDGTLTNTAVDMRSFTTAGGAASNTSFFWISIGTRTF